MLRHGDRISVMRRCIALHKARHKLTSPGATPWTRPASAAWWPLALSSTSRPSLRPPATLTRSLPCVCAGASAQSIHGADGVAARANWLWPKPYMAEKLSSGREAGGFKRLEAARRRSRRPHQMGKAKAHRCFSTPKISSSITSRGTNHSEGSRGNSRVAPTTDALVGARRLRPLRLRQSGGNDHHRKNGDNN